MTGVTETRDYENLAGWLNECLDHEVAPSAKGLREVAQKLQEAADRIEILLLKPPTDTSTAELMLDLSRKHLDAFRANDHERQSKLFTLLTMLEEAYPEAAKEVNLRHPSSM